MSFRTYSLKDPARHKHDLLHDDGFRLKVMLEQRIHFYLDRVSRDALRELAWAVVANTALQVLLDFRLDQYRDWFEIDGSDPLNQIYGPLCNDLLDCINVIDQEVASVGATMVTKCAETFVDVTPNPPPRKSYPEAGVAACSADPAPPLPPNPTTKPFPATPHLTPGHAPLHKPKRPGPRSKTQQPLPSSPLDSNPVRVTSARVVFEQTGKPRTISKVMISGIAARDREDSPTYTENAVTDSLLANPAYSSLAITHQPRWIRNPAPITGLHSSVTVSFEDPDGTALRALVKTRHFVFGGPVTVKPWVDHPPART
ncbi:hypothetical protein BDV93DRAFT_511394 [Ceratobasidium sp. AG-I]|nr:hypothetical protein BDV93DRAFT_511394 [Ceratobasidium sp. AG-I]